MRGRCPGAVVLRVLGVLAIALSVVRLQAQAPDPVLPTGVHAVWDPAKAFSETTATRQRLCLNGLWRWQPGDSLGPAVPAADWGYFKVPGCWPGITDYMQKDSQQVYAHPSWKGGRLGGITMAWYQREITVPQAWDGRQIVLSAEYLNSYAVVYLDGTRVGELRYPGGEIELAGAQPGGQYRLALAVAALPLKGVLLSYSDTASAREVRGTVARRGLCGDVYLAGLPRGPQIRGARIHSSVRSGELSVEAELSALAPAARYTLRARVFEGDEQVRDFASPVFQANQLEQGQVRFKHRWLPERLWDVHTPQNTFTLVLSLRDEAGRELDAHWRQRFGFREFWIEGRDFYLNGSRIYLSAVPLDNAQVSAALASYPAARESLERLKSFGINFVYTHNYGCEPGSHLSFTEVLRAADDVGMLVALSQPHFSHYDWQGREADRTNGYAGHAAFYVGVAGNHPSVVAYAMSHNATGYNEDMNPDMIDGLQEARDTWARRNVQLAQRAEGLVRRLDSNRIVYHHASGNLGPLHAINFYPNFVPVQEMSDWFEHWATAGVKPVFTCEYGAPFTWDWAMYRGWFKGQREFGSAAVPWEFCLAEWNAQFVGDAAFQISAAEKANLRWEARQFDAGKVWHRWDYPFSLGSDQFDERYPIFARYITDNWRAFRTWGISANSPWEHGHFWKLRPGVDQRRQEFPVDWQNLQRPGFSPDYTEQRYARMDLAFERTDWLPTPAADALLRNNRPLLGYIAGGPTRFTSKDHNFLPGETVEKQLLVINNSRATVACDFEWSLRLPQALSGSGRVTVATGQQERVPVRMDLPSSLAPGQYEIRARFQFGPGESQQDRFWIDVLPPPTDVRLRARIARFDPQGETAALLDRLGIASEPVGPETDLAPFDLLIVGKKALTLTNPAPDIRRVRDGLKVILFEQTAPVLEKRFGFRVQEYGLREVFARIPDHPALAGLTADNLHDWRGQSSLLAPRLQYQMRPRHGPTVEWCGIPVTRLWRRGNQGTVASVLIEKPVRGDFLPILDGGYSLQYAPLLEYREGSGTVVFCQLDVTGRTELEPAAERLLRNVLRHVVELQPRAQRQAFYAGDPKGKAHLESIGVRTETLAVDRLGPGHVLIAGRGSAAVLRQGRAGLAHWLQSGGHLLAVGLDQEELGLWLPWLVSTQPGEHIAARLAPFEQGSLLAGVGSADVHNRAPRELPLVRGGARIFGGGILAQAEEAKAVFCQLEPWQFESKSQSNLRRTHRRASFLLTRLLANMGVAGSTPLLERFHQAALPEEKRWLEGFYLDEPEEWDDPYRFFRW